ncbi:Cyanovirin-N [Biscogniauxia mediterranea]|nr:Cyanovirin-N [Biscogniauxia mediterranea]
MSFFTTSENIRLEDNHFLRARLKKVNGDWVESEINLNDFIGNNDGHFAWDGKNFAQSAENIRISIEGTGPVCVLRARLRTKNGELRDSDLNLSERLGNNDGRLVWV